MTLAWPPTLNTLHSVLATKFGGRRVFLKQFDLWLTPDWLLHDLCMTLWSRILLTNFDCLRAFLSNLALGWPYMTPKWPLTPKMHYTPVRSSSHRNWWPYGIPKAISPLDDLWPLRGSLRKYAFELRWPVPYPYAKFQLHTLKHH